MCVVGASASADQRPRRRPTAFGSRRAVAGRTICLDAAGWLRDGCLVAQWSGDRARRGALRAHRTGEPRAARRRRQGRVRRGFRAFHQGRPGGRRDLPRRRRDHRRLAARPPRRQALEHADEVVKTLGETVKILSRSNVPTDTPHVEGRFRLFKQEAPRCPRRAHARRPRRPRRHDVGPWTQTPQGSCSRGTKSR